MPASAVPTSGFGPVECSSLSWREHGALHVTVVVKATLALVPDGAAMLLPAGAAPDVGIPGAAIDLAPYKARADVTFVGHAYAPPDRDAASAAVRLAVFAAGRPQRALVDKTLHVYGDRNELGGPPQPFQRVALVWARGGGLGATGRPPNVVDPRAPGSPAGFGPVVRAAPGGGPGVLGLEADGEASILEVPEAFDWSLLQLAPRDQQVELLRGDEWIVLDGLHPSLPRLSTRLPSLRAAARAYVAERGQRQPGRAIALVADTLAIEGDLQRCTVVWRGSFPVPGGARALSELSLVAGLEVPGKPTEWPEPGRPQPTPAVTLGVDALRAARGDALPFVPSAASNLPVARERPETARGAPQAPPAEEAAGEGALPGTLKLTAEQQAFLSAARRGPTPFPAPRSGDHEAPLRPASLPGAPWTDQPAPPPPAPDEDVTYTLELGPPAPPPSPDAGGAAEALGLGAHFLAAPPRKA